MQAATLGGAAVGGPRSFDHYARLVQRLLHVPVSLVTLVEGDRQVFPGMAGPLPEPYRSTRQTPLAYSLCQHVVADQAPLIICDARDEPRLCANLAITELDVVAYAGWPLRDAQDHVVGSLCAVDVVSREWSSEQLGVLEDLAHACSAELQVLAAQAEESERLARTIFESVDVAMAFYGSDRSLVMANERAHRLAAAAGFRLDDPPYAGAQVRRADKQEQVPFADQVVARALRGDLRSQAMEWVGPPGQQLAVEASAQAVERADGTPWGTLVAFHDVTGLARSLEVKGEFIPTVSHELRTPLTSVLGYVEILAEELGDRDEFAAATLATIAQNADHLRERVEELLDAGDRRRSLDLAPSDVALVARRVMTTLHEPARAAGIRLDGPRGGRAWATVDARRIEQALENLVVNAIKYSEPGGTVQVRVAQEEQGVLLFVGDQGMGMSQDEVDQAFESFWRANTARRSAVQGIGIGLTLVHRIVRAHHGSVRVSSEPGRGTTVEIRLPREPGGRGED